MTPTLSQLTDSVAIAGAAAGGSNVFMSLVLPFAAMAAVMYFLIIRPQQQQRKKHQEMLDAIRKGDTIVTVGGLIGKVSKVSEDELQLDLGETRVRVVKGMIANVKGKGEPVAANDKG